MRKINRLLLLALFLLSAAGTTDAQISLIDDMSIWTYTDRGVQPGSAWKNVVFNDGSWSSGTPEFGYGEMDETTVIGFGPDSGDKYITTWFRHIFQVPDPSLIQNLRLRVLRDDGVVIYLNGSEIVRSNMASGPVVASQRAFSTVGQAEETFWFSFDVDPAALLTGSNVIAIELHQSSPTSSDLSLDVELDANVLPSVIRGPYLQVAKDDGITVCWRTDVATDGQVWFGATPGNLTQSVLDSTHAQDHFVQLSGLASETEFVYAVGSSAGMLAGDDLNHVFKTTPPIGAVRPTRVWALGDCGTADVFSAAVRDQYESLTGSARTDLVLLLGDNAYNRGTDGEYEFSIFQTYTDMLRKSPFWSTRGNHESSAAEYFSIFEMPTNAEAGGLASGTEKYYSFDHGNVHFICLDSHSTNRSVGGGMWTWAQADLASTNQHWIVAFWHHPPYSKGNHDSDTEQNLIDMRENFVPLFESYGVDIVLAGHSHSYERSFLINGHHGDTTTWDANTMLVDGGDGNPSGDGAYIKPAGSDQGATYLTAGASGKITTGQPLNHPAMFVSSALLGSLILSFNGNQLDVQYLDALGVIFDEFTLRKEIAMVPDVATISLSAGGSQTMTMEAGSGRAGDLYAVFGSGTGTSPGVDFGPVNVPLNFDIYFRFTIFQPGLSFFKNYRGMLNGQGGATASFQMPPASDPGLAGITLWHAFITAEIFGNVDYSSNAIEVLLVP